MIKLLSSIILLWALISVDLSFAQAKTEGIKIYSGYYHQTKKVEAKLDRQCLIEFKSPVSFLSRGALKLPEKLTYFIRFKNEEGNIYSPTIIAKSVFEHFDIKIYTTDDQAYDIDPEGEGIHQGFIGEHPIFDKHLIELILGKDIDHLEVVNTSNYNDQSKYILDKVVIYDN